MTRDELERAWDLWFDLAQSTNDSDPEYTHGVFVRVMTERPDGAPSADPPSSAEQREP